MADIPYLKLDAEVLPSAFEHVVGRNIHSNRFERYMRAAERKQPLLMKALRFGIDWQGSTIGHPDDKAAYSHGFAIYTEALAATAARKRLLAPKIGERSLRRFVGLNAELFSPEYMQTLRNVADKNLSESDMQQVKKIEQDNRGSVDEMTIGTDVVMDLLGSSPFTDEIAAFHNMYVTERLETNVKRTAIFVTNEHDFAVGSLNALIQRDPQYDSSAQYLLGAADAAMMHYGAVAISLHP